MILNKEMYAIKSWTLQYTNVCELRRETKKMRQTCLGLVHVTAVYHNFSCWGMIQFLSLCIEHKILYLRSIKWNSSYGAMQV